MSAASTSPAGSAPQATPVAEAQRIVFLDVLRGFAVLGILFANIPFMSMAEAIATPFDDAVGGDHWTDHASYAFVFFFADTKFITIFSTLFGAGLALMSEKAIAQNQPFGWRYARRLAALLCIGWGHALLLWFGDILVFYALLGFVAMWFRRASPKVLGILGATLLVLNGILWLAMGLVPPEMLVAANGEAQAEEVAKYREVFASGDLAAMVEERVVLHGVSLIIMILFFALRTLGLFFIGMAWIRAGGLNRFGLRRRPLFRIAILGGGLGLTLHALAFLCGWSLDTPLLQRIGYFVGVYFGGLCQAAAYVALFMLWMHTNLFSALRRRLAAVGRMALTNYLSHSLFTGIVFNYCGQFDQWRRPYLLLLVLVIFAFQLWMSPIWLRHFRYGPAEWIWRMGTYLRPIPIRRSVARG